MPAAKRKVLWDAVGYVPSEEQALAHYSPERQKEVAGGERGGKSLWTAREVLTWMPALEKGEFIWLVGPTYEMARAEFQYLSGDLVKLGMLDPKAISYPLNGSCTLTTEWGAQVETTTSSEVMRLASRAPAGVAMVEAAQQSWEAYLRCRGRVAEHRGPLVLSGTFEGSLGWYPELWQEWQVPNEEGGKSFSLPTWSNLAVFPGGRDDPEIKALEATYPPDVFMERFGAVPCPPANLVFREFSPTVHVKPCPYREELTTQVWIDPGWAGAYAVLAVQIEEGTVYVLDEVYYQGKTAQEIIQECKGREWWPGVAKSKRGVIDVAGRQHPGMESHIEIWAREAGIMPFSQVVGIPDGILRHRTFLRDPANGEPRIFHDPKCVNTIKEYGLYRYYQGKENRKVREDPIDANNHALKAVAYGLVSNFGFVAPAVLSPMKFVIRRG